MADLSFYLSQAWFVFLLSLAVTALVFPLVFILSFVYDALAEKYDKTPKILLMALVTFVGVLIAVLAVEIYLEFTLPFAFAP
ncbi:MAG: hypothetical protein V1787_04505 [Candidatus Micrarchaeota archaeon]